MAFQLTGQAATSSGERRPNGRSTHTAGVDFLIRNTGSSAADPPTAIHNRGLVHSRPCPARVCGVDVSGPTVNGCVTDAPPDGRRK